MKKNVLFSLLFFIANYGVSSPLLDSLKNDAANVNLKYEQRASAYQYLTILHLKSSLDSSFTYADKYIEFATQNKDLKGVCLATFYKGISLSDHFQYEESILYLDSSLIIANQFNDTDYISLILMNKGMILGRRGKYKNALSILLQAKSLSLQNGNWRRTLSILNGIGNIYETINDYSNSQLTFFEAIKLNRFYEDDGDFNAMFAIGLGNNYKQLSNYEEAISWYLKAIQYADKIGKPSSKMIALANISLSYLVLERYEEAKNNIRKSILFFKEQDEKLLETKAYTILGNAYVNNSDSALFWFKKALNLANEICSFEEIAVNNNQIALIYIDQSNFETAKTYLDEAQDIGVSNSYFRLLSKTYRLYAKMYFQIDSNQGMSYIDKALSISDSLNLIESKIDIYHILYAHYKSKKDYANALINYELYQQFNDSTLSEDSKLKIEEIETRYEVDKKDQEITLLQKEQEIAEIKHVQEQGKNRQQRVLIILISSIIVLIIGVVLIRLRAVQKSKIQKLENRSLKVETKMLRSQMNPHFIFNSLNSIQSFISNNDTLDAERYMAKFAKLMRLILDNSRRSFIAMVNEVDTLTHYLELEALRFDNRFQFSIDTSKIEEEFIKVPPMLVQPYIENAILHGVGGIKNGLITICYEERNKKIICTIDDNGIGRKKSATIKTNTKHESLGIKVTQERISLFETDFSTRFNIEIIDKIGGNNNPLGTTVIIEMPFIEK